MTATEVRVASDATAAAPTTAPTLPRGGFPEVSAAEFQVKHFSLLHVPRLPTAVRESRHRMLIAVLAIHVPLLILLGIGQHHGSATSGELAIPVVVATLLARFLHDRLGRSLATVLGLAWCSYAVIYLSGGSPDAYLHPLLVVALIALYQDPLLLGSGLAALTLALAVPAAAQPHLVFAPGSPGDSRPALWTFVHVLAALGVAAASALAWRRDVPVPVFADPGPAPDEQELDPEIAEHVLRARAAELALARRQASYALMTNLARRNQSLVGRQLGTLDDLERDERDPDVLSGLFALDHLATRMRRNAENLLVLAGAPDGVNRSFSQPVPVDELLRGAAAEVEQYARVTVSVGTDGAVAGHVVSDVAHLTAELLDNALACSPPDTQVVVGAAPGKDGGLRLWIADEGIGMTEQRLAEQNALLSDETDDAEVGATLGFPVVKRLAARHGIRVSLSDREGELSGLVAYVDLPVSVVVNGSGKAAATRTTTPMPLAGRRGAKHLPAHATGRTPRRAPRPAPTVEPTSMKGEREHEVRSQSTTSDQPLSSGTHDHVLFGSEPPPAMADLPTPPPEPNIAANPDALPMRHRRPTTDTVVPLPGGHGTLTRRVPQQALRNAGGPPPPPETYQPGDGTGELRTGSDHDRGPGLAAPEARPTSSVVTSYRVGVARGQAETARTRGADTDTDTTDSQGADA
jgi:signal transduction histidine kinase